MRQHPPPPIPQTAPVPISTDLRRVRVVVCEDSHIMREYLLAGLEQTGLQVEGVEDGFALERLLAQRLPDILILDIELPGEDGFTIANRLRKDHPQIGVIMLTARDQLDDRVKGLDSGADLYYGKPVDLRELASAIGSLHRRMSKPSVMHQAAGWRLNASASRLVSPRGQSVDLTETELRFLDCLLARQGSVVDRDVLLKALDQPEDIYAIRRMETMLSRLRSKVGRECPDEPLPVKARQNRGYIFLALAD